MVSTLDVLGTLAFALSGAIVAARHRLDVVGAVALAIVTGLAGGFIRDLALGAVPPRALADAYPVALCIVAALIVTLAPSFVARLHKPLIVFDAIGLGLFAVVGANKAITYEMSVMSAASLGTLSAVGGGVVRDVLVSQTPVVFTPRSGLYVIPAAAGATASALAAYYLTSPSTVAVIMSCAAAAVATVRLLSVRYGWSTPQLSPPEDDNKSSR